MQAIEGRRTIRTHALENYSYSNKCEARAFVNTLATNEFFKSRLIREIKKVTDLLVDPYCEMFTTLTVDYDLIEVNNGCCWSIETRFRLRCYSHQIGKVSSRTFVRLTQREEIPLTQVLQRRSRKQSQTAGWPNSVTISSSCSDTIKKDTRTKCRAWWETQAVSNPLVLSHSRSHPSRKRGHNYKTTSFQQVNDNAF